MTYVKIPVPRFDTGLVSNMIGLLGALLVIVSVGGLTGNYWWSVLVGGLISTTLSYLLAVRDDVDESTTTTVIEHPANGKHATLASMNRVKA